MIEAGENERNNIIKKLCADYVSLVNDRGKYHDDLRAHLSIHLIRKFAYACSISATLLLEDVNLLSDVINNYAIKHNVVFDIHSREERSGGVIFAVEYYYSVKRIGSMVKTDTELFNILDI
jgi:hypothetical protein